MTPTGPNYPNTVVDNADGFAVWSSPANAELEDGAVAYAQLWNGSTALAHTNYLKATGFNFIGIPSAATITGIVVEVKRFGQLATDYSVKLVKGGTISGTDHASLGTNFISGTMTWGAYGSQTDLWGLSLTPADIMSSNFGVAFAFTASHDPPDSNYSVDAIRITVYYSVAALAVNTGMPKTYLYKVYNSVGSYLGMLPTPSNDFAYSQDINSGGSQITVEVPVSADTAFTQPTDTILDESGGNIQDENSNNITTDGGVPLVSSGGGSDTLIKNGNKLIVWEFGYYYPSGHVAFRGDMERWEATFGGDAQQESIKVLVYSDGQTLNNYLPTGYGVLVPDQIQTTQNDFGIFTTTSSLVGQVFTTGAGVTAVGAITLHLAAVSTANTVTVHFCLYPGGPEIGSAALSVSSLTAADYQFIFSTPIASTPGMSYFFYVTASDTNGIKVYLQDSTPYPGGREYGFASGSWFAITTQQMYFETFSAPISTIVAYNNQDPSTGMLESFMNQYIAAGGPITYTNSSIDATGLTLSYTLNTNTVYEAIQAMLSIAPNGFYFYVDLGTDTLYFKRASTVADIVLTKGRHLSQITIVGTIEYVINQVYFSGGQVGGANIYTIDQDSTSIAEYGTRLDRQSDNRVTVAATAHAIGGSEVAQKKNEQYQTVVTVVDKTMDITLFKPGMIVGFNGFGTFVDNLFAQIVRIDYTPEQATLQLGLLPTRQINEVEQVTKGLVALNTINNPTTPS